MFVVDFWGCVTVVGKKILCGYEEVVLEDRTIPARETKYFVYAVAGMGRNAQTGLYEGSVTLHRVQASKELYDKVQAQMVVDAMIRYENGALKVLRLDL